MTHEADTTGPHGGRHDPNPEVLEELLAALGGRVTDGGPVWEAEPVGSGSVEGLAGSGVLDVAVDLFPFPVDARQRQALTALGYRLVHESEQSQVFRSDEHGVALQLHEPESERWHGSVLLRDYLRQDQTARRRHPGPDRPRAEREAVLDALERDARAWHVARTGFSPVESIVRAFTSYAGLWMISSGWALDLHLGKPTRPHRDVDVTFPRPDQLAMRDFLVGEGWRLDLVQDGRYVPWVRAVELPHMQVHARRGGQFLDLLFAETEGELWRFRRDPRVTMPLTRVRRQTREGIPYLAPEIVLLFKSARADGTSRGKDASDFERVHPGLDGQARAWLRDALALYRPGHPWIERLT